MINNQTGKECAVSSSIAVIVVVVRSGSHTNRVDHQIVQAKVVQAKVVQAWW